VALNLFNLALFSILELGVVAVIVFFLKIVQSHALY
jgi:hypothetical protein